MMFHVAKGLYFERQKSGAVRLIKTYDERAPREDNVVLDMFLPSNIWASIIASMSKHGEGNGGWQRAIEFHNGRGDSSP